MGLQDPAFTSDYLFTDTKETALENLMSDKKSEDYTILLSHRPELFLKYADCTGRFSVKWSCAWRTNSSSFSWRNCSTKSRFIPKI